MSNEMELRRRLLSYVIGRIDESTLRLAADAMHDLLADAHEEMASELLSPIFSFSDYWPCLMAGELLGLEDGEDYGVLGLLEVIEQREIGPEASKRNANWKNEGF